MIFFSTINFSYQYLPEAKAYLEPSQTSTMELFHENFFFAKLTSIHLFRSLFLIKLQVSILQLHWKKGCTHIWNQHPRICQIAKFREKMKMPTIGTKNALFSYLWVKTLKNYCHIQNQHLRIRQIAKFRKNMKMPKFETKNVFFAYFWAGIWKQYYHIWNQHLRICLIGKLCKKIKFPKFETKNVLSG